MKVVFDGFETIEQAKAFADWYSGQGEQESDTWLQEHTDIRFAGAENITVKEDIVEVQLKLYKS